MEPVTRLYDIAQSVLAEVENRLEDAGITLPERRFVVTGEPSADCEQLTVSIVRLFNGQPGNEIAGRIPCAITRTAELRVDVRRCTPAMENAPEPNEINGVSQQIASDGWAIFIGLILAHSEQTLLNGHYDLAVGPVEFYTWESGTAGSTCLVSVQL